MSPWRKCLGFLDDFLLVFRIQLAVNALRAGQGVVWVG